VPPTLIVLPQTHSNPTNTTKPHNNQFIYHQVEEEEEEEEEAWEGPLVVRKHTQTKVHGPKKKTIAS